MKEDEAYSAISANSHATFITSRPMLIRSLCSMFRKAKLCPRTYFLSILYMDDILGRHDVKEEGLGLIVVCCLYIAGTIIRLGISSKISEASRN